MVVNKAMTNDETLAGTPLPTLDATSIEVSFNNIVGTKNPIYMMFKGEDKKHEGVGAALEI